MYRVTEHQADIAVEIQADDRNTLFIEALKSVVYLLTDEHPGTGTADFYLPLKVNGFDDEEKLVSLMNEMLYVCQTRKQIPVSFKEIVFDNKDSVSVRTGFIHCNETPCFVRDIKAATYHNLEIRCEPTWHVRIVFDV